MIGLKTMSKALLKKLENKDYRSAYVASHTRRWIAHQIRALREMPDRNWKQGDLAKAMDKPQSVVSRLEDPSYGKMTINTLLEVAKAFDVALLVRFVDYKTFLAQTRDVTDSAMKVDSFHAPSQFAISVCAPAPSPTFSNKVISAGGTWHTFSRNISLIAVGQDSFSGTFTSSGKSDDGWFPGMIPATPYPQLSTIPDDNFASA